uniref:Uncharacterized protein n=1 Tax=Daucus carota subsp. sativus TaxID=79200 RepID=A0A164SML3_DAUCS
MVSHSTKKIPRTNFKLKISLNYHKLLPDYLITFNLAQHQKRLPGFLEVRDVRIAALLLHSQNTSYSAIDKCGEAYSVMNPSFFDISIVYIHQQLAVGTDEVPRPLPAQISVQSFYC